MLETIREYGLEQLQATGEVEEAHDRHARFYLALAQQAAEGLVGHGQEAWLDRLETEHRNLQAAVTWAAATDPEIALTLVGALHLFWIARGYVGEGRATLERVLSLRETRHHPARVAALQAAVRILWVQGNYQDAYGYAEEWLALARERDDQTALAWALHDLGRLRVAMDTRAEVDGQVLLEQSLTRFRTRGDAHGTASALNYLGEAARYRGDYKRAIARYEESLPAFRALGEGVGIITVLLNWGAASRALGEPAQARELYREALTAAHALADPEGIGYAVAGVAGLAVDGGHLVAAARLLGVTNGTCAALGTVMEPADRTQVECDTAAARSRLSDQAFTAAWEAGRALSLDDAVAEALALADELTVVAAIPLGTA